MADKNTPQTRDDFENMSDEEFMKLSELDYSGNVPEGESSLTSETNHETPPNEEPLSETDGSTDPSTNDSESDDAGANPDSSTSSENEEGASPEEGETNEAEQNDDKFLETHPNAETNTEENGEQSGSDPEEKEENADPEVKDKGKETPAKAGYYKLPEGTDTAKVDAALGFYETMMKPFKADGKDFTVRSAEDAVRLMQQGVNYSRRMQEIKPMKALNRMLTDHELNDPAKLNFLIDLSKGDKNAITQLLKSHKIDPMDLDTEKETRYQARNYQGDPQDNDFRDALDTALTTPEGQALVSHIHADWDRQSKAKLRENPAIIGNLSEMKASGVYDKVVEELTYQKSMGYLVGTPFLQAFDQVGEAMKNAGVFGSTENPAQNGDNSMAPLQNNQRQDPTPSNQPVASGARKSTGVKKPETNPHLSSTPPSKQTGNTPKTPDFDKMSDEDFLKMAPPE